VYLVLMNKSLVYTKTPTMATPGSVSPAVLTDFRTNQRVLMLSALALPIGMIGSLKSIQPQPFQFLKRKTI
jgi:hypothetical protein